MDALFILIFSAVKIVFLFCWAYIRYEKSLDKSETLIARVYFLSPFKKMNDLTFHNPEGVGTHFHVYPLCQRHFARRRVRSCDSTEDGGSHGTHAYKLAHF